MGGGQFSRGLLDTGLVHVGEGDPAAQGGQLGGDLQAEALGGSGDQRQAALETGVARFGLDQEAAQITEPDGGRELGGKLVAQRRDEPVGDDQPLTCLAGQLDGGRPAALGGHGVHRHGTHRHPGLARQQATHHRRQLPQHRPMARPPRGGRNHRQVHCVLGHDSIVSTLPTWSWGGLPAQSMWMAPARPAVSPPVTLTVTWPSPSRFLWAASPTVVMG